MVQSTNKVIITGGLGFIFSHVTEYLVSKGYEVVVIDDISKGSHQEIINDSFRFYEHDCADNKTQDIIIKENPDYIIHASAISDVDFSIKDPEYTLKQNILSTINVFEAARFCTNLKKLVYISTDEVYGECDAKKNETDIIFPKNPYSVSKAVGSIMRIAYDSTYHYLRDKTCETRFCNVFGDRQDTRKILPLIKKSLETGEKLPVQNGGSGYREYIYVKEIPPIIEMLMHRGDRTYNITNNDGFTVNELIKKCEDITGKKVNTLESFRPGMDMKYQMDNTRIKELGWSPVYKIDDALKEYLC